MPKEEKERPESQAGGSAEAGLKDGEAQTGGAEGAQSADQPAVELAALREEHKKLEAELSELKDQYLRKVAEFENFRKRLNRDKEEAIAFANTNLLADIIPVLDDFERALKSVGEGREGDSLYQGVAMIEKQFVSSLQSKWGLSRFESKGAEFDPNLHEAVGMETGDDVKVATVIEDYIKGYTLNGRVVRPAKVRVKMPLNPESGASQEQGTQGDPASK
jgi:molecular chaperone GrpE